MLTRDQLLTLADALANHIDRSQATISNRIVGHARLFSRLQDGKGCGLDTAEKAHHWFAENWPVDLTWPDDIPRPKKSKEAA